MIWACAVGALGSIRSQPSEIIKTDHSHVFFRLQEPLKKSNCEGCGAPYKAYTHRCEYCKRERQ